VCLCLCVCVCVCVYYARACATNSQVLICQSFLQTHDATLEAMSQKSIPSSGMLFPSATASSSPLQQSAQETGDTLGGGKDNIDVCDQGTNPKTLVCCATLKHAGGDAMAVCAVKETHQRTVLLATASEPDKALRLWQLSENGQNATHLHTAAPLPSHIVALYSSPLIGGKVFSGGSFPSDVIEIYNTDSVRDSVLWSAGSGAHPPLRPLARLGQPGNHIEVHAMLAVDSSKLLSGDDGGVVSKWDIESGRRELDLKGHSLGVRSLARLDDNTFLSGCSLSLCLSLSVSLSLSLSVTLSLPLAISKTILVRFLLHTHTQTHTHTHVVMHIHIHTYKYIHAHSHTQTHNRVD
jgi:hypothetical protein